MAANWEKFTPGAQHPLRHGLAFLFSGLISFSVDGLVLKFLTLAFGLHPIVARLAAISIAMVAGWLAHRTFTFALTTRPTVTEFLRYAAVGWGVSAINYGVFVGVVLARPSIEPLIALLVSSFVAMFFAYAGMRFAAFRTHE
ncbi:MAG TPA: GtrA family protein [Hyphomicrobiaceae bacterium]|jgi:putative flippase GtrA|nr:GtrA family protein [Hyphomicrobiaceae bacterium]